MRVKDRILAKSFFVGYWNLGQGGQLPGEAGVGTSDSQARARGLVAKGVDKRPDLSSGGLPACATTKKILALRKGHVITCQARKKNGGKPKGPRKSLDRSSYMGPSCPEWISRKRHNARADESRSGEDFSPRAAGIAQP